MSAPSHVSKKLKFKGDKVKKKKRAHREVEDDGFGELDEGDPTGWIFPSSPSEISGPAFIILPTTPPTCLAWEATRQRVYAAPLVLPVMPALPGEDEPAEPMDLSPNEVLQVVEPTEVHCVWVVGRLSGAEGVISLRSSSGTFLTAAPSGALSAQTPSRGPLESFVPVQSSSSSPFPTFSLKTNSDKYLTVSAPSSSTSSGSKLVVGKPQWEVRGDAEEVSLDGVGWRIKCQREFVMKARMESLGEEGKRRKVGPDGRPLAAGRGEGSLDDEVARNKKYQAWGGGKSVIGEGDRRDLKKARKDGTLNEAMLDRRAKLKHDKFC